MRNPITEARISAGYSQASLARAAHLSPMTILRHEQGLPALVSGKIAIPLNADLPRLQAEYEDWQRWKRQLINAPNANPYHDNFQDFRTSLGYPSQVGFCIAFCVHQASLNAYESGRQRRMPSQLIQALDQSGVLTYTEVQSLEERILNARVQRAKAS